MTAYGLFGEVKASMVAEEDRCRAEEDECVVKMVCPVRQANRYHIWLLLKILILCLIYAVYEIRLPGRDTIVTLKVRMDD